MEKVNSIDYQQIIKEGQYKKSAQANLPKHDVFVNTLDQQIKNNVRFSKHALERISSRGIDLSERELDGLKQAVDKASDKGLKESLVMINDTALIVSIRNKTVITALKKESLREKVITNVDGVVIV